MPAPDPVPFEDVLDAARAGESWAWRALYEEYSPAVVGYLRARGARDPDDLVGEVFFSLVRSLGKFEGDRQAFRSWLFTIAHRRMVDAARTRARQREDLIEDPPAGHAIGDAEADAMRSLADGEIKAILSTLSRDQQAVLLLRLFGDMTLEEIARAMGRRVGAVKQLQRRGLLALRRNAEARGVPLRVGSNDSVDG